MKIAHITLLLLASLLYLGCKGDCDDYTFGVEPCKEGETCVEISPLKIPSTFSYAEKEQYIITNDLAYNELKKIDSLSGDPHPSAIEWPQIDFDKNILVGKTIEYTGHGVGTSYRCVKSDENYTFYITTIYTGNYDILGMEQCWLLAPKIDSAKISFNVKKIKCK